MFGDYDLSAQLPQLLLEFAYAVEALLLEALRASLEGGLPFEGCALHNSFANNSCTEGYMMPLRFLRSAASFSSRSFSSRTLAIVTA